MLAKALAAIRQKRADPLAAPHAADLVVPRPSGAVPCVVAVRVLPVAATDMPCLAAGPLAMVFMRDPGPQSSLADLPVRLAFTLTGAEAQLAGALLQGVSPHDDADARGLSRNTVCTRLRRPREKPGCGTVAGPVRLPGRMHPPFRDAGDDARRRGLREKARAAGFSRPRACLIRNA